MLPEKARVQSVLFTAREWVVLFHGEARWFTNWKEAYDYAYVVARVRNVVADALRYDNQVHVTEGGGYWELPA